MSAKLPDVGVPHQAQSWREWITLAETHEAAAKMLAEKRVTTTLAYVHAGHAVECAMKAYIMSSTRMNKWPSIEEDGRFYKHGLDRLSAIVGLRPSPRDAVAPAWKLFLRWDINFRYDARGMSRNTARSFNDAAFGENGVVTWLKTRCL